MKWQEWRNERLWNLDVDDLYKANLTAVNEIYNFCKAGKHTKDEKILSIEDACWLFTNAGWEGEENKQIIGNCYSLSKMTIIDDMEDFDNYNIMKKVEFYEFLGRAAEQLI